MTLKLLAPQPLRSEHDTGQFSCGKVELDDWLRRRAWSNHESGASRVYVSTDEAGRVYGYYAIAAGAVAHAEATGAVRRNMPDPVPVVVLGRLARDISAHGMSLGAALLRDAVNRTASCAHEIGIRAMLVHAIDAQAASFYEYYGFKPSPIHPLTLMLRLG
jgi:GNAT superfamily N-acetyltransferase